MLISRKPTFFTSDWHINHGNCLKFDSRPFKHTTEMHEALIRNYNAQVPSNGICYFLGDIATGPTEIVHSVISRLNGTKVLIVGNHDRAYASMYNCGFDVVMNSATLYIHNQRVTMSHCPLMGVFRENTEGMLRSPKNEKWHGESRNTAYSVKDEGQLHLCGHIHSPNKGNSIKVLGRQFDVGVPANKYRPVSMSEIESWIMKTAPRANTWVEIPNNPDYRINYYGEVKSFKRYKEGRYVSPYMDKDGYLKLSLCQNSKPKGYFVHRLVAMTFLENTNNLPQVNHRDGHKLNCSVDNLEWTSNTNNQRHAWINDLKTVKLTVSNVKEIKERLLAGESNTAIALRFGVDQSLISNIKTGKIWNSVFEVKNENN